MMLVNRTAKKFARNRLIHNRISFEIHITHRSKWSFLSEFHQHSNDSPYSTFINLVKKWTLYFWRFFEVDSIGLQTRFVQWIELVSQYFKYISIPYERFFILLQYYSLYCIIVDYSLYVFFWNINQKKNFQYSNEEEYNNNRSNK
jgi:hypothetical protein